MKTSGSTPIETAPPEAGCTTEACPLFVDLDGTLVKSDLLVEGIFALLRRNPLYLFLAFGWLARGKAYFKAQVAARTTLDIPHLPYHPSLLDYLRGEWARGRQLVLATAADGRLARQIAAHLGIFHAVLASDGQRNLAGSEKLAAILRQCGEAEFDYAGNARADLPLCRRARRAILVNADWRLVRGLRGCAVPREIFDDRRGRIAAWLQGMRVHQWLKNLLLFLSLLTTHQWHQPAQLLAAAIGFLAFSLSASAIYLVNDLLDLPADRRHPHKRRRPFAAGDLPLQQAIPLIGLLLAGALLLARLLPAPFLWVLLVYLAATNAYSFYLKRVVLIDVVTLAGLYTLRVVAGAAAIDVAPSLWLLSFSMFIFLSLALVKRYAELRALAVTKITSARGRDYNRSDLAIIHSMGIASGFLSVVVFALFIDSPELARDYARPTVLWLFCPVLLYWIGRIWVKAGRGEMNEDPLLFAVRDRTSRLVLLLGILMVFFAQ